MEITKKLLFEFMQDTHPITFKRWMLDEEKFRDGKIRKFIEGGELKFGDEWTPLNDKDFKEECKKFEIEFGA